MRFVHLSPGAGDSFYCENCLRDAAMVLALRRIGHDASCVPLYLPLMTEAAVDEAARGKVFFGGVNVYLQQKFGLFRHTPRWIDRLFDARRLLRWAGRKAGMTSPAEVAETMLSMLRGEHGRQVKELERLVAFLAEHERPDIVSLSNVLLSGLVRRIKQVLGVPVICSLQDEEGYVDGLPEPHRSRAWDILRQRAAEIDAFIAPSEFYRARMQERLGVPAERFRVIFDAIDPAGLAPAAVPPNPPAVGFLSQMTAGKGLDTLAEGFIRLRHSGRFRDLRLRVFGGMTDADVDFVRRIRGRLESAGLAAAADFPATFEPAKKLEFLQSCTIVSVPTRHGEAFGFFALECLACGVPLVLPDHGAFGEILRATGGGLLCRPNDPAALAEALDKALSDPAALAEMARRGRQAVLEHYTAQRMATQVEELCRQVLDNARLAAAHPKA